MHIILAIFLSFLAIVSLFWLIIFVYFNDITVPSTNTAHYKKILLVFPHPDDEVMTAGGIAAAHGNTTLLILSKGERGTPKGQLDEKLKLIRTQEAKQATKILRIKKLIHQDYGDGLMENKKDDICREIHRTLMQEKPDLVISYDLSGLYGHPDHMAVSSAVTEIIKQDFPKVTLWYATYPKKVLDILSLPEHMAKDKKFKEKRTFPTVKVFIGLKIINKLQALRAYASQYQSFQQELPIPIPTIFFDSMALYEYFYQAN